MCQNNLSDIWPDDLYFVVPASGGLYINDTENIISLPSSFNGWKVRVIRNNTPLDYGNQGLGDPYFTHDTATNTIGLSVDASTNEKFMIQAYKPTA
jgi:hypothetical protein